MNTKARKLISSWLLVGVFMIFIQVMLGGITRLTGSGLSITEWNVIMGTLPPMNQQQWQEAFDQYKIFPQFKIVNSEMTLAGFKSIFWWEYVHRLWARLMGVAFVIPLIYFLIKKMIDRRLLKHLVIIFFLGALQGLLGWIMVQSGLIDKPWVSPIDLSAHLVLALILYSYLLHVALELWPSTSTDHGIRNLKKFSTILLGLIFLQIFYGGLMAGNKAALFYPTFPKIGTNYIPAGLFSFDPWPINFVENIGMIQVVHRTLGLIVGCCIIYFSWQGWRRTTVSYLKITMIWFAALVIIQIALGILTLINSLGRIDVGYALLHQIVGLLILSTMVFLRFHCRKEPDSAYKNEVAMFSGSNMNVIYPVKS